jgi:hypothetical protein
MIDASVTVTPTKDVSSPYNIAKYKTASSSGSKPDIIYTTENTKEIYKKINAALGITSAE